MFFLLSKILYFLICPISWLAGLLIAALITKKAGLRKRLLIISVVVLWIFSNPFFLDEFAKQWDISSGPIKPDATYSCAIVLGGFSSGDDAGNGYFNGAADRFIQGLKLKTTGKVSHLLISGGNGNLVPGKFREAAWVKTQLKEFNVPDSAILIESNSRNTIENAAYSRDLLQRSHLQPPYLLVTSAFHMRRSLGIFKHAKIDVIPYTCDYDAGRADFSFTRLFPDAATLSEWNVYIKEVIGITVNLVKK